MTVSTKLQRVKKMSSIQLFYRRMIRDWKYQIKTFRSIADWTIWLYLIIPANVISFFIYRSWWLDEVPNWVEWMPLSLFFLLGYLFSWNGSYRTFTEEADKVFLVKKEKLFFGLKHWGFLYSLAIQAIWTLLVVVVLLPFLLRHYQLTIAHALVYFLFLLTIKYGIMYLKFLLKKIERKTIRIILTILLFLLLSWFSQLMALPWGQGDFWAVIIVSLIAGVAGIGLYYPLLKKNALFEIELNIEKEEKLKLVNAIYTMSYDIEKPKITSRKKPWLFRNSKLIFKNRTARNGFVELFIKIFVRNSSYILTYFQICSVTAAAIIIVPPWWIKVILFTAFLFMMWIWLGVTWDRIALSHPFMKKYNEHDAYFSARRWTTAALFILSILVVGVIVSFGFLLYSMLQF